MRNYAEFLWQRTTQFAKEKQNKSLIEKGGKAMVKEHSIQSNKDAE